MQTKLKGVLVGVMMRLVGDESSSSTHQEGTQIFVTKERFLPNGYKELADLKTLRSEFQTKASLLGTRIAFAGISGWLIESGGTAEKAMRDLVSDFRGRYADCVEAFIKSYPAAVESLAFEYPGRAAQIRAAAPSAQDIAKGFSFEEMFFDVGQLGFSEEAQARICAMVPAAAASQIAQIIKASVGSPFDEDPTKALAARENWNKRAMLAAKARPLLERVIQKIAGVASYHEKLAEWPEYLKEKLAMVPVSGRLDEDLTGELKAVYEHMLVPRNLLAGPPKKAAPTAQQTQMQTQPQAKEEDDFFNFGVSSAPQGEDQQPVAANSHTDMFGW